MRVISARRLGVLVGAGVCAVALAGCGSSGASKDAGGSGASSGSGGSASSSASPSPSSSPSTGGSGAEEGKPAKKVLADAKSALFNTKAVHITGNVTTAGQAVDLDMQFQGQDAEGTVRLGPVEVGIVKTHGQVYVKASRAFWSRTLGSKGAALSGKWIKVDAQNSGGLGSLSLQGIAASLNASDSPLEPKTTTATVDGQKAVVVTQKDGGRLYVADSDDPVPLRIVSSGEKAEGTVRFTGYGTTRQIKAPAHALTPQQALKSGGVSKT
jgi:hypothetical protein